MNISHPRYLSYGNANSLDVGYPACLEKKINGGQTEPAACADDKLQSVYLFPEVCVVRLFMLVFKLFSSLISFL